MPDLPYPMSLGRWLRFSVRGLIFFVLVVAGWMGWVSMNRTVLAYVIGSLIVGALIFGARRLWNPTHRRAIISDVVQGIICGGVLAFITTHILFSTYVTKVNGWTTIFGCGEPGNGVILRAACAYTFPGPVNVPQEAMYWTTKVDGAGRALFGTHNYILHFAPGGLPPNDAFWSLTMGDAQNHFVANPINRYSVSDRSGLMPDADGSVNVYIQRTAPVGHESNWLPAPSGKFILWLRVYLPGAAILKGEYKVPPVVEAL
jgi:hypothetical protein